MSKELDRLEKLKLNSIENPGKKKRGCTSCKKPKEVNEPLPPVEYLYLPTVEDIKQAYVMLSDLKEEEKPFIQQVYNSLFDDEFDFYCPSCIHRQTRALQNYIKDTLKIKL
jgi:hypothetical protein